MLAWPTASTLNPWPAHKGSLGRDAGSKRSLDRWALLFVGAHYKVT